MVTLSPSTLLDSPEIYKIESNLISLFERTFKKGINSDIHKLKSSVKRGFSSATFKIQIDKIIDDIYIYTIDFTDKLLKTTLKADFHTIHISHFLSASDANIRDGYLELTEEAVTECTSLASEITESIIRVLKDEAIYQESNDKLAARVLNLWGGEKYRAERWARTFSADVATNTTLYRYQTSGIEEYQFYATIDNRTSPQCRMLHGCVMKTNSNEANNFRPPLHPHCLVAGTKIITLNGEKNIENVDIGDIVLTHLGNYMQVYDTMSRHTEDIIEISTRSRTIKITTNHPVLSKRNNTILWIPAGELKEGDEIVVV